MPLTSFQADLVRLLSVHRSPDSYLAGGAAMHLEPNTKRYSNDLDYFHDSADRVATAFASDRELLTAQGFELTIEMNQPGYIRGMVSKGEQSTKIEWAHDSAWRFLPTIAQEDVGFLLHPIDLAINKVLALAGRDEPRDFVDVMHVNESILPLGVLCWAASGKDPGFTPFSLLDLLRRRGKYQPEEFARLHLVEAIDLPQQKTRWLAALQQATVFVRSRPPEEVGCLYYSRTQSRFVDPTVQPSGDDIACHYGRPGGVLPQVARKL